MAIRAISPSSTFGRFACWLSRCDNAFTLLNFIIAPPLVAIVLIGFF